MEALGADSDDAQINGQPIAGAHLADKMEVVFKIHGSGFAKTVACVAEPDSRIKRVARVIEHNDVVSDVHVLVAVGPIGARDRLVAGRAQLLNLFRRDMRWLHRSILVLPSIAKILSEHPRSSGRDSPGSDLPTAFHGLPDRDFIRKFQVAADRHAHCDPRDAHAERLQQLR